MYVYEFGFNTDKYGTSLEFNKLLFDYQQKFATSAVNN